MLLSVGYPVLPSINISDTVIRHKERVGEVYFAWRNAPSGRMPMSDETQAKLESDLKLFHEEGIKLCLLLNGNCYGAEAVSQKFADEIKRVINEVKNICAPLYAATTTSPFVAHVIKNEFPEIKVKASINMRIGTVEGMDYLKELFDGFYVQREYNRDFKRLSELKKWADENGKKLYGLLNSGCMNFCSNQTFHDNMVSHEKDLRANAPLLGFNPVACHKFYSKPENRKYFVERGNWIRPEDLKYYNEFFEIGKLATRMHESAPKVIGAYARGSWPGNLTDLLEPRFKDIFVDNREFPENWFLKETLKTS
jgi:collagenase-like PrtC family protease